MNRILRRAGLAALAAAALLAPTAAAVPAQAASACPVIAADGMPTPAPSSNVVWSGCDLSGANLAGADLRLANLSGADLTGANLAGAQLDFVDLSEVTAPGSTWNGVTGGKASFLNADLQDATFTGATLSSPKLDGADLRRATVTDASLTGARLSSASLADATVRASSLRGASATALDLTGVTIDASDLTQATLTVSVFKDATINGTDFTDANLNGGYFSDTATGSGNTWTRATCTDGYSPTQHLGGDCFQVRDEWAPASLYPTVEGPGTGVGNWYTGAVVVHWNWLDEGILSATDCTATTSVPAVDATVTATCTDVAGNVGTASRTLRFDLTAPALSATLSHPVNGANGWYRTAPTLKYTCSDTGSGLATCPAPVTAGQGARTVTVTARDVAGNATTNATALKLDSVKPTVWANVSSLNGYGAQVPLCRASDATSGLATCRLTTAASTSSSYRYATATATDKAGNTAVSSRVLYRATTAAAFTSAPTAVRRSARFTLRFTSKNAKGALFTVYGVRSLTPVRTTSTGSGPANTTWSTWAVRTGTGTYSLSVTAPRTTGYYRYAIRVGNATLTRVIRVY